MDKHGDFFPENPQNVDELIDALAQRAAAAQRMLNSMTRRAARRADAARAAGVRLAGAHAVSSSQLDANLQSLRPGEDWGGSERFDGEQGLGLGDGTGVLQDLADLDDLAEQLSQSYDGARLDDVDLDKLARQLGDEAAVDARTLQRARAGAARLRLPQAQLRRPAQAHARRRCASSARRCCKTSPPGCPAARASATCARPARPASCRARPASGRSATPSRGT